MFSFFGSPRIPSDFRLNLAFTDNTDLHFHIIDVANDLTIVKKACQREGEIVREQQQQKVNPNCPAAVY